MVSGHWLLKWIPRRSDIMPCEALVVGNLELVAISGLRVTWGSLEASPRGT